MSMSHPRRLVFLLFQDCLTLDFVGPMQVFEVACENSSNDLPYVWQFCSVNGGMIRTSAGLELSTTPLRACDPSGIDTLIVGGGPGVHRAAADEQLIAWLHQVAANVRRVCSVCTGAFVLAAAGLLNGRRAATHWGSCDLLSQKYPDVSVQSDPVFVHDSGVWTSAGVTAGIDLALSLLENDAGHREAMRVAQRLVVFLKRPGGQAQFSVPLLFQSSEDNMFEEISSWIQDNLRGDLRVECLAEKASDICAPFQK
jgi:transcriptional regulator GlxA family with amidase domain